MAEIKTNKKYIIGMIISIVAMNALYIICAIGWWKEEAPSHLLGYGILIAVYGGVTILIIWLIQRLKRLVEKGLEAWQKGLVLLLLVLFTMFWGGNLGSEQFYMKLSALAKTLWILLYCMLVWGLCCQMKRWQPRLTWFYDVVYFAAVFVGILFFEELLVPQQSQRWDTVETCYLLAAADAVYLLWRKDSRNEKAFVFKAVILSLPIVVVTIMRNERLLSIINQTGLRLSGREPFRNTPALNADWIAYRITGLSANIKRNMELPILMADSRENTMYDLRKGWLSMEKHPLTTINQYCGMIVVLLIIFLLAVFLICLWKLSAASSCFMGKAFCICLIIKSVLAFLSELFMVWSCDVIFPMIGYGISDLAVFVCVLYLIRRNNVSTIK